MSYGYRTRIGYHEVGSDRKLTLASLIDLFQDCGGFHGDDCGYSNQALADQGLAWILNSWQIVISRRAGLGEWINLMTSPYKYRHFMANRYFMLESENHEEYVRADSVWILMDMNEYKPVRITKEMADAYAEACDEDPDIFKGYDFGGRKIQKTGEFIRQKEIEIAPYMIDTNYHVNNGQYVKLAQCCLPEDFSWNTFRSEYTKQARLGDVLIPERSVSDGVCQIALNDTSGEQVFLGEWSSRDLPA